MKALLLEGEFRPKSGHKVTEYEQRTGKSYKGNEVFYNPQLSIVDIPIPKPGPGEVLVKVKATGVCGSDVHLSQRDPDGYTAYPWHCRLPVVLGHEWSGQVVELGESVSSLQIGDPICIEEMNWCGECTPCRSGLVNQCRNLNEIGVTNQGGFAEYVACNAKYCWKVDSIGEAYGDDKAMYELGAMVEPCSVAYNGMFISAEGFQPGGHVLVAGSGPIGLLSIALAKVSGAARIIAMEPSPTRREMATRMGADFAFDPSADGVDPVEVIMDYTKGDGVKMAIEAAAVGEKTYPIFEEVLAPSGKIVQTGLGSKRVSLGVLRVQQEMLHIHGTVGHSGRDIFPSVIRLMAAKKVDPRPMITSRFPLERSIEAVKETEKLVDAKVMVTQY